MNNCSLFCFKNKTMEIKEASFLMSNSDHRKCPEANLHEYAFIGRSNVGKSSLINMLCGRKSLAKTSSTPGKTQLINHFLINKEWYLVDLPGYGYAKVPKSMRGAFHKTITNYILNRENLVCLFVLIDARHSAQKIDLEFMEWLGVSQIPFVIVFTKADKLKPNELAKNLKNYKTEMLKSWEEMPRHIVTSSTDKRGKEEVLDLIDQLNSSY